MRRFGFGECSRSFSTRGGQDEKRAYPPQIRNPNSGIRNFPPAYICPMSFPTRSLLHIRNFAHQLAEGLTDDALNTIPPGFSNNIIWNLAHLVAAEQGVCYIRGGAAPRQPMDFIKAYSRGTRPEAPVSAEGIAHIRALLTATPPVLEADLAAGAFAGYQPWTTPYGTVLNNIDEALQFLLFHEGLHCGYIMALKRALAA